MEIREAFCTDADSLQPLMLQLGYVISVNVIAEKIKQFQDDPHQYIFIAECDSKVAGFLSLSIIPQLAVVGDFARVAYLCVDDEFRGRKIGQALLACAENKAKQLGCNRMELHSGDHRKQAHSFYLARGYEDAPKYFRKLLG